MGKGASLMRTVEAVWRPLLPTGTVVPQLDIDDSDVEALLHKLLQDGIGPGHVDVDVGDVHVDPVVALQEEGGTSRSRPTAWWVNTLHLEADTRAPHPSDLVGGDDGRVGQRLEQLQDHGEGLVSFGLQHQDDGLVEHPNHQHHQQPPQLLLSSTVL